MQPFWLETADNEQLFCWHVLPLDVYLQNEDHLSSITTSGEIADDLKGTASEKLLRADPAARVVVNFHGVSSVTPYICSNAVFAAASQHLIRAGYITIETFRMLSNMCVFIF